MSAAAGEALALALHAADDVAVLTTPARRGDMLRIGGAREGLALRAASELPVGHKVALCDLPAGADVRKYGEIIGRTTAPVAAGEHVHVHNLASRRAAATDGRV